MNRKKNQIPIKHLWSCPTEAPEKLSHIRDNFLNLLCEQTLYIFSPMHRKQMQFQNCGTKTQKLHVKPLQDIKHWNWCIMVKISRERKKHLCTTKLAITCWNREKNDGSLTWENNRQKTHTNSRKAANRHRKIPMGWNIGWNWIKKTKIYKWNSFSWSNHNTSRPIAVVSIVEWTGIDDNNARCGRHDAVKFHPIRLLRELRRTVPYED